MDRTIAKGNTLVKWTVSHVRRGSDKWINVLAKTKNQAIQLVMGWVDDTNRDNIANYTAISDHQATNWADMTAIPLRVSNSYGAIELHKADVQNTGIYSWHMPIWDLLHREDPDPGADWRVAATDFQSAEEIAVSWLRSQGKIFSEYKLIPRNEAAMAIMGMMSSQSTINGPASATTQQPVDGNHNRLWILSLNSGPNAGTELTRFRAPAPTSGVSMRNAAIGYAAQWLRDNGYDIPFGNLDLRWQLISDSGQETPTAPSAQSTPARSLYRVKNLRNQQELEPSVRFASPDEAIQYAKDNFSWFFGENDPCEAFEI